MKYIITCILSLSALFLMHCTRVDNIAGAGSETTNSLTGMVVQSNGTPASNVLVYLIPDSYDIVKEGAIPAKLSDTTDEKGEYIFGRIDTGTYRLQAHSFSEGTRALVSAIHVFGDNVSVATGCSAEDRLREN